MMELLYNIMHFVPILNQDLFLTLATAEIK